MDQLFWCQACIRGKRCVGVASVRTYGFLFSENIKESTIEYIFIQTKKKKFGIYDRHGLSFVIPGRDTVSTIFLKKTASKNYSVIKLVGFLQNELKLWRNSVRFQLMLVFRHVNFSPKIFFSLYHRTILSFEVDKLGKIFF